MSRILECNKELTPQSLVELATRVVVIRIWQKWEGKEVLRINLIARGSRTEPPCPLIRVCYTADLPSSEDKPFLGFPATVLIEKRMDQLWEARKILNTWTSSTPNLCVNLPAFACHILHNDRVAEIPVGRLYLVFHYIRLRTLLEAILVRQEFDENLVMLLNRFDSFIQQQIKELERLRKMLIA